MKKTILILLIFLIGFISMGQTVYIDPTNSGDPNQNGSIEHPWDSWKDFTFVNGRTYLQKCGTVFNTSSGLVIDQKSHITVGSYGIGAKPIIHASNFNGRIWTVNRSQTIVFDGLDVMCDLNPQTPGTGRWGGVGFDFSGHISTPTAINHDVQLKNCDIHQLWGGVRVIRGNNTWDWSADSILIENCNIWQIDEDGIFVSYTTFIDVIGCHLWDINMQWYKGVTAPGDGIQLTWGCRNWKINYNFVDRRSTAGKFSIIVSNLPSTTTSEYSGEVIGNTIYTPKDTVSRWSGDQTGGAGLYIEGEYSVNIAYNKFIGRNYPVASNGTKQRGQGPLYIQNNGTIYFCYNILDSTTAGSTIHDVNTALYFRNNTIISGQGDNGTSNFIQNISDVQYGFIQNNMSAGNTSGTPLRITAVAPTKSNNLATNGGSSNWDNLFGIKDWKNSDFHLTESSIARNTGYAYDGYNFDFDSVAVPQENLRDIGAYEYIQSNPIPDPIQTVTVTDIKNISCKGNWVKVNYATGYKITLMKDNAPVPPYQNYDVGDVSSYDITGLLPNSAYSFFVKGYNVVGEGYGLGTDFTTLCNAPIITNFSTPVTTFNVGVSVTFSSTVVSCNEPIYSWYFENGVPQTSTLKNPVVKWNAPGKYLVSLTITNNGGTVTMTKDDYVNVTAIIPPVASFSINIPVNTKFTFTDFSTNSPTKWEWIFKGGYPETSTEKNPTVYWKSPGRYDVVLTVGNSGGSSTYKMPGYVNVGKSITPNPTPDPTPINENISPR